LYNLWSKDQIGGQTHVHVIWSEDQTGVDLWPWHLTLILQIYGQSYPWLISSY
jgi:hypothetical protein